MGLCKFDNIPWKCDAGASLHASNVMSWSHAVAHFYLFILLSQILLAIGGLRIMTPCMEIKNLTV